MAVLIDIINIVLPVFLVIGLGYFLRSIGFLQDQGNARLSKLVFYVAAPALLFRSTALSPVDQSLNLDVLIVVAGITIGVACLTYFLARGTTPSRRGVWTQGMHRSNMVFMGLPIVANAYGHEVLGPAAVLIGFMVVVYNLLAVLVLALPHQGAGIAASRAWMKTFLEMVKNPLIIGCACGITVSALHIHLPESIDSSFELVGRIALPLALISVGAGMDLGRLRTEVRAAMMASFIKLLVYPALVYMGLLWAGLSGTDLCFPVLIMASPTAVVSYIMAQEMKGDENLAAAIIIGTTLFSLFTVSAWLAFFRLAI
ncbi:MAG: AEC family transporter [Planctomycetota bacterium]